MAECMGMRWMVVEEGALMLMNTYKDAGASYGEWQGQRYWCRQVKEKC